MNLDDTAETGAHEVGHTGGLRHEKAADPSNPREVANSMQQDNLMNATGFGNSNVTSQQLQEIGIYIPADKKSLIIPFVEEVQDQTNLN